MNPSDLQGEARRTFDTWRSVGLSEADAFEAATNVRMDLEIDETLAAITAMNTGVTPEVARQQLETSRRDGRPELADPFDRFVESFRSQGLSAEAAKAAAIGRNSTEAEARAEFREGARADVQQQKDQQVAERLRPAIEAAVKACAFWYSISVAEAQVRLVRLHESWKKLSVDEFEAELRKYAKTFGPEGGPPLSAVQEAAARAKAPSPAPSKAATSTALTEPARPSTK